MYEKDEQSDGIMAKDRQGIIELICSSNYITELEKDQQGLYLFGKTVFGKAGNDRAACLIWSENNNGCVSREILDAAYQEIVCAGLKIPFLFFGWACLCASDSVFTFAQLPWFFQRSSPVLSVLRTINLRGKMRIPVLYRQGDNGL